jgi:hypothetical protein
MEFINYTITGVSLSSTTSKGHAGTPVSSNGVMQFPGGLYDMHGSLMRQSGACGGTAQLNVSALTEVINTGS